MNKRRQYIELAERLSAMADSLARVNSWQFIDKKDKAAIHKLADVIDEVMDPIWIKSLSFKEKKEIGLD